MMNKITVYGLPHCGQCKAFEKYLESNNLSYQIFDNEDKTIELAQENNIMSAPVVEINGKFYNSKDAMNVLGK